MTGGIVTKNTAVLAAEKAVQKHGATRDELIPILNDINQELGYLSVDALEEVSRQMRVPKSQLLSVASFYQMLSTKPRGRHTVKFCESAPCHVAGGRKVWERLLEELKVLPGETTQDGKWTLITVSCLGVCGVGPVLMVDEDIYGNITPGQIRGILARYE